MEVRHFSQQQLAKRWSVSEASLERWRCEGIGPVFMKLHGRVLNIGKWREKCDQNVTEVQKLKSASIHNFLHETPRERGSPQEKRPTEKR